MSPCGRIALGSDLEAVRGHVRGCRDMSPSLGLSRARYSRAVTCIGVGLAPSAVFFICYVML